MTHQDPYEAQGKEYKGNCTCGCHTSEHSDTEMKLNGCDLCYQDEVHQDPYEAQGSNLRVHHPVQPKTQVERWREEKLQNWKFMANHHPEIAHIGCDFEEVFSTCTLEGIDNCYHRFTVKIPELQELILADHEKNKTYINRYQTGTFADDIENAPEYIKKSLFGYNFKKVTLLDKIKKLLWD